MDQAPFEWETGRPLTPRALLLRPWKHDRLPPEHLDEIFQREIHGTAMIAPLANGANAVCIVVLSAFVIPSSMSSFRPWWTALALLAALHPIMWWGPRLRRPERRARTRDVVLLCAEGVLLGVVYASLLFHVRDQIDDGQAIVLCASIAGVLGCGAVARSLNRTIGLSWVVANTALLTAVLVVRPGPGGNVLIGQLNLYAFVLLGAIVYLSSSFELRCRAELAASAEREVVGLLLDDLEGGSRDWLWRTDRQGALVLVSARFAECAGRPPGWLEGQSLVAVLLELGAADHQDGPAVLDEIRARLRDREPFRELLVPVSVRGEPRWWALSGRPADSDRFGLGGWHGVACDVTEARQDAFEISRLVNHDSLTGLYNRHRFHGLLAELTAPGPIPRSFAVGIVDLDNFKGVNDTLGHHIGDELLVDVAGRLEGGTGADEVCARLGGDEFALVIPAATVRDGARRFEALLATLVPPSQVAGSRFEVRASAGFAMFPADATDPDELVSLADQALYAAKGAGRDQVRAFAPAMREEAMARANALRELALAVERDEFVLHAQPIVEVDSGAVAGMEVLVRWQHPERGLVAPGDFIPVAEETGLIVAIGERVMAQAFAAAAGWPAPLRVAVNISPVQLTSVGFVDAFDLARRTAGVASERIDVEVTESTMVDDRALAVLEELRGQGVGVAVDDFGTGYSSFATLQRGPVTQIKIDQAFVSQLDGVLTSPSTAVVRSIVQASQALGLDTVAEGVETVEQRAALEHLGCQMVQGYLESRPLPLDTVPAFLQRRRVGRRSRRVR